MDKAKQIEEMKNIIDDAWGRHPAEDLYDAGYRKQSDTAREIFAEIDKLLSVGADGEATLDITALHRLQQKYVKE